MDPSNAYWFAGGVHTTTFTRNLLLVGATVTMGLVAGVFVLYAHTVMPALRRTDDRTFVASFQAIDKAIINPLFIGGSFLGALALTLAAALTSRGRPAFPFVAAALAAYIVSVIVTIAVNVPLNDAIKAAGDPATIDVAATRAAFHATRWEIANLARAVLTTGSFTALAWSLTLAE